MSLWEIVQAEWHITHRAFLMEWTLPQIFLLTKARVQRDNDAKNKTEDGSIDDLNEVVEGSTW